MYYYVYILYQSFSSLIEISSSSNDAFKSVLIGIDLLYFNQYHIKETHSMFDLLNISYTYLNDKSASTQFTEILTPRQLRLVNTGHIDIVAQKKIEKPAMAQYTLLFIIINEKSCIDRISEELRHSF